MRGLFQRWLCVLFLAGVRGSPFLALGPIRCAPCTPEKLRDCPAVAPGCAEVQRESGCGCCSVCALGKGEPCGVYTAHCGTGLRCTPKPEDPRPMHSLIHGQATCTEYTESQASQSPGDAEVNIEVALDGYGSMLCMLSEDKPTDPKDLVDAQESIKAKINAIRNKLVEHGPCHTELHRALDKIATTQFKLGDKFTTFYLPNCDKHGFYKSKQCETSLDGQEARCWCVSSWNGKRLPGTSDLLGQSDCQQEVAH